MPPWTNKPGAFGKKMTPGGDPSRSEQDWQKTGGEPPAEQVTLNRYYQCEVCAGYFALQAMGDPFNTNFDVVFDTMLLQLRRTHGGLDLCLACEASGINMGNLTDKIRLARIEWRKGHPQKEFEKQFKAQNRKRR